MTTQNKQNDSNWGLMIFKDTFEYLIDGDMSNDEFCTLMRCVYNLRENGELPNEDELPKTVKLVWKTLKHSISKSATNARYYDKRKSNKSKTVKNKEINEDYYCPWTDEETGEIYTPTDQAYTSDLTIDPVLEEEQSGNLNDYILGHQDGMMRHQTFSGFIQEFPNAERLQQLSNISLVSANTLYQHLRQKEFQI